MAARTAIGLDIGTSVVRAVELSVKRGTVTLERFGQVVLPEGTVVDGEVVQPEQVTVCLRQLWSATGFSHKRVVMGVANGRVVVRQVDLPWMTRDELRVSLPMLVQDYLPMAVDQAVLDFFPLEELAGESGRQLRGLLVGAARETVLANVGCAERAGLSVTSVDLTSFAVLRARSSRLASDVGTEALIDVGARVTNIVIHSSGTPKFVRILLQGGQDVTVAVADRLGLPMVEAERRKLAIAAGTEDEASVSRAVAATAQDFVDEVRGSLDYFGAANPGGGVERIVLTGGGSRLEGLADRLSAATRLPVVVGDPFAGLQIGSTGLEEHQLAFVRPLAAVPVGLAMGGIA